MHHAHVVKRQVSREVGHEVVRVVKRQVGREIGREVVRVVKSEVVVRSREIPGGEPTSLPVYPLASLNYTPQIPCRLKRCKLLSTPGLRSRSVQA